MTTDGYCISLVGDNENDLKLTVVVFAQLCESTETIVHLKLLSCVVVNGIKWFFKSPTFEKLSNEKTGKDKNRHLRKEDVHMKGYSASF